MTVMVPVGPPPTYNGGIPSTVSLDPYLGDNTYTFPASAFSSSSGYALTYSATGNGVTLPSAGVSLNSATRTFTATNSPHDRSVTIVLTATDTHGQHVSCSFTIIITGGVGTNAVGGGSLDSHASGTTVATQQTTTPNIQSYWFTYDADNRVQVSGGELTGGKILIDDRNKGVKDNFRIKVTGTISEFHLQRRHPQQKAELHRHPQPCNTPCAWPRTGLSRQLSAQQVLKGLAPAHAYGLKVVHHGQQLSRRSYFDIATISPTSPVLSTPGQTCLTLPLLAIRMVVGVPMMRALIAESIEAVMS
jgi:hypothetical protein